MNTYLTEAEKKVLPELMKAIVNVPVDGQKILLGYALAVIDLGQMKEEIHAAG